MTKKKQQPTAGLESLVGEAVELRGSTGAVYRGTLIAVGPEWLVLDQHRGGRAHLRIGAVSAIVLDRPSWQPLPETAP